jgi:hypothetical protein
LEAYFSSLSLIGIAPFTLIIVDFSGQLYLKEYVWDGNQLHIKALPIATKIWSSRQLYSPETAKLREDWFSLFLQQNELQQERLLAFHKHAGMGDPLTNLVMNRDFVKTTSISSFYKDKNEIHFRYEELATGTIVNTFL